MNQVQFYVFNNSSRKIIRVGSCAFDQVSIQQRAGETAREGAAILGQLVNSAGDVIQPSQPVPFSLTNDASTLTGLPTETKVSFAGTFRIATGTFANPRNRTLLVEMTHPSYFPASTVLEPVPGGGDPNDPPEQPP